MTKEKVCGKIRSCILFIEGNIRVFSLTQCRFSKHQEVKSFQAIHAVHGVCPVCCVCVLCVVYVCAVCVVCVYVCGVTHTQIMGRSAMNPVLQQSSNLSLPPTPEPSQLVIRSERSIFLQMVRTERLAD